MVPIIKALILASIALFFSLVAYGNITDYQTNWHFVQHVLSMDTIFKDSAVMSRAINDVELQHFVYSIIIIWQLITASICWIATFWILSSSRRACLASYKKAKKLACLGLSFGFLLYMLGFIDIAGEWFAMWQSTAWNGQKSAGLYITIIMLALIFISMPEDE